MSKQKTKQKSKEKKKTKVLMTQKELSDRLYALLTRHIGRKKAMSRRALFTALFGEPENYTSLEVFWLWHRIKRAMNWVRKTTKMFIISRKGKHGSWEYFVARDEIDSKYYLDLMATLKKKQNYMIKRCKKAVHEQWWREL